MKNRMTQSYLLFNKQQHKMNKEYFYTNKEDGFIANRTTLRLINNELEWLEPDFYMYEENDLCSMPVPFTNIRKKIDLGDNESD